MQTSFTAKQLKNPRIAEVDKILRRCVHCGFCTATCPTYVLLGDERDSPRGRIYLMKEMFEHGRRASPEVQRHVDRCLSCLSCMTTCPSGVDYMHLVDYTRAHIEETGTRSLKERIVRGLIAGTLPFPHRFRLALRAARLAKPFLGVLRVLGLKELVAMLELAPKGLLRGAGNGSRTDDRLRVRERRVGRGELPFQSERADDRNQQFRARRIEFHALGQASDGLVETSRFEIRRAEAGKDFGPAPARLQDLLERLDRFVAALEIVERQPLVISRFGERGIDVECLSRELERLLRIAELPLAFGEQRDELLTDHACCAEYPDFDRHRLRVLVRSCWCVSCRRLLFRAGRVQKKSRRGGEPVGSRSLD
jgi:ferredoxin